MTVPVTGPYTKAITVNGPPTSLGFKPVHLSITQRWFRQKKPYNLPLDYSLRQSRIHNYRSNDGTTYRNINTGVWYTGAVDGILDPAVYNTAYKKFVNKVRGEQAQLGVMWLERQQTLDMITKRLTQFRKFVRAMRHFQWDEAWKVAGLNRSRDREITLPEWRRQARGGGGTWLEYHFGWVPTIRDVMRGVDLLSGDWPRVRVKTHAAQSRYVVETANSGFNFQRVEHTNVLGWTLAAEIEVSNPNLLLADQVGLVNPLTLVWEVIPFSFLLDWVANVNDYLESFYPFVGVTLVRPYRTRYHDKNQNHMLPNHPAFERWLAKEVMVDRITGAFPGPTLRVQVPSALSATRAATAAALLLQTLKRGKQTSDGNPFK